MRIENIISDPVKKTYKYTVYGAFSFCGLFLFGFIAWSLSCFGGAAYQLMSTSI